MVEIRLRSLNFGTPPFRKLGEMTIPIAERLTIVAGHNGIGKSTILALVANASGLTRGRFRSYFDRTFQQSFNEIIHLDYAAEYQDVIADGRQLPAPTLEYTVDGSTLIKKCSITPRTERAELRIVVRSDPHKKLQASSGFTIGPDAKVPLPTIYLGMIRMLPIGESDPEWVTTTPELAFDSEDARFIQDFVRGIVATGRKSVTDPSIVGQAVRGTKKTAKHPPYAYDSRAISLGQDSLSSIATAVASFRKLRRDWKDYSGGLLVIDELDAGLHPHAQRMLLRALLNSASDLGLQVIATTHSMKLIEAVHPDLQPAASRAYLRDAVVYLADTARPFLLPDLGIEAIRTDMDLAPPTLKPSKPANAPSVKVYLEDPEAAFFFQRLVTTAMKARIRRATGTTLKQVALSVGSENLRAFHRHDPYFKSVVLVLDGDAKRLPKDPPNLVILPCSVSDGRGHNPERTLYTFIEQLAGDDPGVEIQRTSLRRRVVTTDQLRTNLLDETIAINKRDSAKAWFRSRKGRIDDWSLVELWADAHPDIVAAFEQNLVDAVLAALQARQ